MRFRHVRLCTLLVITLLVLVLLHKTQWKTTTGVTAVGSYKEIDLIHILNQIDGAQNNSANNGDNNDKKNLNPPDSYKTNGYKFDAMANNIQESIRKNNLTKRVSRLDFLKSKISKTNYEKILEVLNVLSVPENDPRLLEIIRTYYIVPPSKEPYNLSNPNRVEYSNGQTPFVDSRLNYMEGGFYIECGALNGEKGSNTLFFEKVRKWNGLLIEADPANYAELRSKHRRAYSMNACLSPTKGFKKLTFNQAFNMGRLMHDDVSLKWKERLRIKDAPVQIQCFPLYSILLALNQTTVDFFSLDVEGDELNVLKTIPFEKVTIKMLTVEYTHGDLGQSHLQRFMQSKGYETLLKVQRDDGGVNDFIFRKIGLTH